MRPPIWLLPLLMPHSLAFSSHSRFCVNDYFAKMNTKIAINISSGRNGVRLEVIQCTAVFETSVFILTRKDYLNTSFEL